jgi:DNA end-binding protein Ku
MPARSLWNGTITFGSVVIPVKLFAAVTPHAIRFREVRVSDGSPIEHRRIGAESGDEVAYAEIEKGHDTGDGIVVLTKQEIAAAEGPRPKVIAIERFVDAHQIDPVFYDKPYIVGAQAGGEHAYRVLLAALERCDRVGIGRFVLRTREQLVAVRPLRGALGLQTMRHADELVEQDDLEVPSLRKKPADRELKMAGRLVGMLTEPWDPDAHEDEYRAAVMALIERKREGKQIERPEPKVESDDDLLAALEASLGSKPARKRPGSRAGGPRGGVGSRGATKGKTTTAAKKAPAKKAPAKNAPAKKAAAKQRSAPAQATPKPKAKT